MTRSLRPETPTVGASLTAYAKIAMDHAGSVDDARNLGQREIADALARQRRETDTVTALADRASRLDHDVNRAVVRSGAQRPKPTTATTAMSVAEIEKVLDAITKDLRALGPKLDWLDRNVPRPAAAPTPRPVPQDPAPSVVAIPEVVSPAPTSGRPPWTWAVVAAAVTLVLVVLVLVLG